MNQAGAIIVGDINLPNYDNNRKYTTAGVLEDVDKYLASFPATRENFNNICKSNRTIIFGTQNQCLRFINNFPKNTVKKRALKVIYNNRAYVEKAMQKFKLDALLLPISLTGIATYDNKHAMFLVPFPSNAGLPSITFTVGYIDHMPVGLQLVGSFNSEKKLIAMAYSYEKKFSTKYPPILEPDSSIEKYSIADLNNLFTLIGIDAYRKVLKPHGYRSLTPEIFRKIVSENIKNYKKN